jgi:hypothetical protein
VVKAVVKAIQAFYLQQLIKEVVACFGTLYFATNDEIEGGYMTEIARRVQTSLSHALR